MTKAFRWGSRLPTLQTPRLTLRPLAAPDVADVFSIFSDPDVVRYWDGPLMATHQDAMQYIEHIHQSFRRRELFQWGLADTDTNAIIGTCTLTRLSHVHERCEIGFALRRTHWGRGFGSEMLQAMIEFAFVKLDLHRIEADVDPRNARCLRLLERFGFVREGCLRERYFLNGERQDAIVMGLLRSAWPPRSA